MKRTMEANLVVEALMMALMRRRWPRGVIFHSDRGLQHAGEALRRHPKRHGLEQGMSRNDGCQDDAATESFFSTLKTELCGEGVFATQPEGQAEIFEYIEIFDNRERFHSTLGYLAPAEFEKARERRATR